MRPVSQLVLILLAGLAGGVLGQQQGLPFQVNHKKTCQTQTSIDARTLTGVRRGDETAPCSGYLMYTDAGSTRRMCTDGTYGFSDAAAERACYTLGVNFFRDTTAFDSSRTRQMKLYQCFNYKEQGVDSIEHGKTVSEDVFDASFIFNDWQQTLCLDGRADPAAFDCFDTCYFTSPAYGKPYATTEYRCDDGEPFFTLGCADINECQNGVRDYCTGPFESSCTIRKACGNNTDCTNYPGSFECSCKNGFEYRSGDSYDPYDLDKGCKDVDECEESKCDVNAQCVNTIGSYLCWCKDGFSGDGKTCTPIKCPFPPQLPNAKFIVTPNGNQDFGDTVVYECDEGHKVSLQSLPEALVNYYGYTTTRSFVLTCEKDGNWGPHPIPHCVPVDCGDPGVIANADRLGMGSMYGQQVTYTCSDGYQAEPYYTLTTFTRTCQADGTWTEGASCLDIDECKVPKVCADEQHCVNIKGSYLCLDNSEYCNGRVRRGEREQDSYPCGSPNSCDLAEFCKNGECREVNNKAVCVCDDGYVGLRCETPAVGTALILAVVGLVVSGVLITGILVERFVGLVRRNQSRANGPRAINRGPLSTKVGFGRPAMRWPGY